MNSKQTLYCIRFQKKILKYLSFLKKIGVPEMEKQEGDRQRAENVM